MRRGFRQRKTSAAAERDVHLRERTVSHDAARATESVVIEPRVLTMAPDDPGTESSIEIRAMATLFLHYSAACRGDRLAASWSR